MTNPSNVEVESALLSRLMIQPDQISALDLTSEDFYDREHRLIWTAMRSLAEQERPIDLMSIRSEAGQSVSLPIGSITAGHHAPLDEYARLLRNLTWRRRYISQLQAAMHRAAVEDEPQELLADLQDWSGELSSGVDTAAVLGRQHLADHQGAPEDPFLGVLSPQGTTILYGDGGDGKGWVAAKLASQLDRKVAIIDFEMQPKEWAYRLDKFGVSLNDVLYYSPPTTLDRWATPSAARMLKAEGVGYLMIDSAMYAADMEDPYSPKGAIAYGQARRRLGNLPALLLAHTTGGADKVFGSVFWRNESRIVWRLNKEYQTRQRFLDCRKANGYSWLEGKRINIEFDEPNGILNLHPHGTSWTPQKVA